VDFDPLTNEIYVVFWAFEGDPKRNKERLGTQGRRWCQVVKKLILGRCKKCSECENYYRSFCLKLSAPPCLLSQTAKGVKQAQVFVENKECFGVWPKHGYFNFFEGGLLCLRN